MHLNSLTLINIRQLNKRSFQFRPGFNLLVGENGAGKTTILRSLLAALGGKQPPGQRRRRPKLEDEDIRLHTNYGEVHAEVKLSSGQLEKVNFRKTLWEPVHRSRRRHDLPLVLFYSSNEATCSGMRVKTAKRVGGFEIDELRSSEAFLYDVEMEFARTPRSHDERRFGNSRSIREFVGRVLSTFSSDFGDFSWRFEPYGCTLLPPDREKPLRQKGSMDIDSFENDVSKQAIAAAMRYFQEGKSKRRSRPFDWPDQSKVVLTTEEVSTGRRRDQLPKLDNIWNDLKLSSTARKFLHGCSLEVKLTPRIMIHRRVGSIGLSQLSDGEQRLFSLFVDIARQLSLLNSRDEIGSGEAIVLIDEIDVHLHPKWQRKIVPSLKSLFTECQFIATTHSPFVIQSLSAGELMSLETSRQFLGEYSNQSIEDIVEEVQGVQMPQRNYRAEVLSTAVEEYFKVLQDPHAAKAALMQAEATFREASEPFAPNPGLNAFLKLEAMAALKSKTE